MRLLRSAWTLIGQEPVLTRAFLFAALVAAVEFGLPVTDGQAKALDVAIGAFLALTARRRVTPVPAEPLGKATVQRILGKA